MTDLHLNGRLVLLSLDLEELGDQFPHISALIRAEMEMIRDEQALRAKGKSKPTPSVPETGPSEWEDIDSLAALAETVQMED